MLRSRLLISGLFALTACRSAPREAPPPPPGATTSTAAARAAPAVSEVPLASTGVNLPWMDTAADPCADFFAYSCGQLVATLEIPGDHAAWGPGAALAEDNEKLLRATLESAAKEPGGDPGREKLGRWWSACMDEAAIESAKLTPIQALLDRAAAVKDLKSLQRAIFALHQATIFPLFDLTSQQDYKDATRMIAALDQSGLGLPDRDYYLGTDPRSKEIVAFYLGHVERMLQLAGDKPATAKSEAKQVLAIETALAKISQDKVVRRDPYAVYHKLDRPGLMATAPRFPWEAYFAELGFPEIVELTVNSPEYFQQLDGLMASQPVSAWRAYLRWTILEAESGRLGKAFIAERQQLSKLLFGTEEVMPRWRRCVGSADDALGELLGQEYARTKFDAEAKETAVQLLFDVRQAMSAELEQLPWMDAATRAAAQEKLGRMNGKIGYPDRWRSYDFEVGARSYAENSLAADRWELRRRLRKVGKPVDRDEWLMTPPTVNAYYDPSLNEMAFPAGILQPPYFSKAFAAATNYGATGATMGHELTHGFDDEGAQFDGAGNLRDWWSPATAQQFKARTKCVVDQYAQYEAVPGVRLNGELTAGENIADIGGVKLALAAFRAAQARAQRPIRAGGYDETQLFFIAYGQSWCEKMRPELLETMAKTNPHSPVRFRVNGVVANLPEFARAFSCKSGAPLAPAQPCSVW